MTVPLEPVTFTSGDGETSVPSYLATPAVPGSHPEVRVVVVFHGFAFRPAGAQPGKVCTFYDGARHGFAVRTHPGYAEEAARQSFDAARDFLAAHLMRA